MRTPARWPVCLSALMLLAACASSPPARSASAPEIDPKDPLATTMLMQQGQSLVMEGRIADGMEKYKVALKLQPRNPTLHNLIGMAELQRGEAAKAVESFNQALMLAPKYSDARNNRGAAYVQLGQYAMAEADFLSVLSDETHANRSGVYFNLGSLYLARGNLAAAEENLRRSTKGAGPVDAYSLLGQVEEKLGKTVLAEEAYRDAMTRAPERPDLVLSLAKLVESQGRRDEAHTLYHKVIELAPTSPEAKQARARLE